MPLPNPGMNFTPFDVLPASELNDLVENIEALANGTALPLKLGVSQVTTPQSGITTETDVTGLVTGITAPGGRDLRITVHVSGIYSSVTNDTAYLTVHEGATRINYEATGVLGDSTGFEQGRTMVFRVPAPTAGTHTYKVRAARYVGSGGIALNASSTAPSFILVEAI